MDGVRRNHKIIDYIPQDKAPNYNTHLLFVICHLISIKEPY